MIILLLYIYDICKFLFFLQLIYFIITKIFYLIFFFVNSTLFHGKVKQNIIWTANTVSIE